MSITLYYPCEDLKRPYNQPYGANKAYYSQWGLDGHEGIDFYAPHGSKIFACADGVVSMVNSPDVAGYNKAHNYGIHVRIKHAGGYETIYAHFHVLQVKVGDPIHAGQVLGLADSTGNSTGSHLHLTLKLNGKIIDPTPYIVRERAIIDNKECYVQANFGVNIRKEPNTNHARIGLMNQGQRADVITRATDIQGNSWYQIKYGDLIGWVHGSYVTEYNCDDIDDTQELDPVKDLNDLKVLIVKIQDDTGIIKSKIADIEKSITTAVGWFE